MEETKPEENAGAAGEILLHALLQRDGRVKCIAKRGDGTGDADKQGYDKGEAQHPRKVAAVERMRIAGRFTSQPGNHCERTQQQHGVGEVSRQVEGSTGRGILSDVAKQNQSCAESPFQKDEDAGEQAEQPDLVLPRERTIGPEAQRQNSEYSEGAADAMAELDEGLNPAAIAEPLVHCRKASCCRSRRLNH